MGNQKDALDLAPNSVPRLRTDGDREAFKNGMASENADRAREVLLQDLLRILFSHLASIGNLVGTGCPSCVDCATPLQAAHKDQSIGNA